MYLLDTDHITVLKYIESERAHRLFTRLSLATMAGKTVGTTIIGVEEQMRGWLAAIAKERLPRRQVAPYHELSQLFEFFRPFQIAPFNDEAADRFAGFSSIRIKSSDRKAAAITLVHDATLLTANRRDFEQIPGLKFENWLDP